MTSFVAIFTIEFLKLLRKKYRVVTDSVIQDNFAFQRFNLPRDSIHSTRLYTLIRKRRIPVSRESFPLSFLSSPLPRSLDSRYPPSRSPPPECSPRSKRSFRRAIRSRQVTAASTKAFESPGEIEWPRLAVKFRFVDLISLLGMPRFLCLLSSSPPFLFCFWMAAVAAYDRANSVPDKSGDPITRFSRPVLRKLPSRTIVQRESSRDHLF